MITTMTTMHNSLELLKLIYYIFDLKNGISAAMMACLSILLFPCIKPNNSIRDWHHVILFL